MMRETLPSMTRAEKAEALGALATQLHDGLYGGEEGSIWCDESAWRALPPEHQDNLWRAGIEPDSFRISLISRLAMMTRTGYTAGRRVRPEELEELKASVKNIKKHLESVEWHHDAVGGVR